MPDLFFATFTQRPRFVDSMVIEFPGAPKQIRSKDPGDDAPWEFVGVHLPTGGVQPWRAVGAEAVR